MADQQHRATDSEWYYIKARGCGSKADVVAYSTIHELLCRIEALEARNEDDKEAWAAMRRAGSRAANRIGDLMERIEDLENDRRAIPDSSSRSRVGLHSSPAMPPGSVKQAASAISEAFCAEVNEVAARIRAAAGMQAELNHPASSDGSLLSRVACADGPADAILEVAAWFREQGGPIASGWAMRLEQEAER